MIKPGICSITFRNKKPSEIIELSKRNQLVGIEWGEDVHVPAGDLHHAERIGRLTREAGLEVAGFGTYWFARDEAPQPTPFEPLLATAQALGAETIRIWAGSLTLEKNPAYFETVVEKVHEFAEAASKVGIRLAFEHHENTFTETLAGSLQLLNRIECPNVDTYWQPPHGSDLPQRLGEIEALKDRLSNLHVFHWAHSSTPPYPRLPLVDGSAFWPACLAAADEPEMTRYALLEFVRDDSLKQFEEDAATLNSWLEQL